jgi:hypothetical protein
MARRKFKIKKIRIDEHDAPVVAYALVKQMQRTKSELEALRIAQGRDLTKEERWLLPANLQYLPREELQEQIDPWISLIQAQEWLIKTFTFIDEEDEKPSIMYRLNPDGWYKTTWSLQCPHECTVFGDRCQAEKGHKGDCWCYKLDGSYEWHLNPDEHPHPKRDDAVCGTTPPDHDSYIHPVDKQSYRSLYTFVKIDDADLIARLERDEIPDGENASIDRPLSEAQIKKLKDKGIIV